MKNLFYLFLFLLCSSAYSQSLSIFDVDTAKFPVMKVKFYAFDKDGNQLHPNVSDFSISENGLPRTVLNVTCPNPKPQSPLSSVLVFDVSGSMTGEPLDMEKEIANSWINMLNLGFSDCAITSFSDGNYINQDFTTNKNKLINGINSLGIIGGTDYNDAMINPAAGGILMAKTGKHKRIIIFLTDGQPNFEPRTQEIIDEANKNNISIYCLSINMLAHHSMVEFSTQTGGLYFENISSKEEAEKVLSMILAIAQNDEPCEIDWQSESECKIITKLNLTEISLLDQGIKDTLIYLVPEQAVANLEIIPTYIMFNNVIPGNKKDTIIKITARNANFNITNIISSNSAYTISNTNFNLIKDQSIDIKITFSSEDSNYSFSKFVFESNTCTTNYYVSSRFYDKKIKVKTLKLTKPNGTEEFVIGSDSIITWEGIPESDNVQLEYSFDKGINWKLITNNASDFKYLWKNIPRPESNQCKVKVKQIGDDKISYKPGTLQYTFKGHTDVVHAVNWSPDGSYIATSSFDATAIIWDGSTGANLHTLRRHANKIWDVSWSPDGNQLATASEDRTAIIWDVKSGSITHTLKSHSNCLWNISWDPKGNYIATSSDDSSAIIWDALTGVNLHTFKGNSGSVNNVSWSPDGKLIATSNDSNNAIIWDVTTGTKLHTLNGHTDLVIKVIWSPDGSRLATASFDNTAMIWDASSGDLLHTLYGHNDYVWDICWSPDGSRLATASFDDKAIIWDAFTGKKIHSLTKHKGNINSISWSPDSKRLATGSSDFTAIIWDASLGEIIYTLIGHTNYINKVSWSPDGCYVATSSWDNTAKIWRIDNSVFQEDESDSVFSIVAPHASANNIDMKECLVGMVKDSIIKNVIENIGSYPIRIDSIYFTGTDASNFRLLSHILPISIKPYDKISLEFGFGPSRVGLHSADIIILTQSDTLFKNIIGTGYLPQLSLKSKILDFGEVYIGSERTFTDTVLVKNISAVAIDISSSYQVGPDKTQFEIISGEGSFKLNPNEERKLTVRFKPSNAGRTSGGIAFEYNGVGSPAMVTLFGVGKNKEPNLQSNMAKIPNLICSNVSQGRLSIKNKCTEIIYFSEINFKGNNAADFSVPNFEPFIIEPDSTKYVNIQFNPQFAGIRTAELEIISTAEPDSVIKINLTAKKDSINISSLENTIYLGNLYLNQPKDSSITLKNYGTLITGASLNSSSNIEISKNVIELSVDETIKIPFKLKGQSNEGNIDEKITFYDSICNINKEIKIIGTTSKANPHASIQVGSLEAYPGDTIEIPITFIDKNDLEIAGITSLNAELSYNSTLLLPIGYNPDFVEFSTSKIKLTNLPITNTEIAKIKFIAGLGNTELSILNLENVHPIGDTAKIETQPGIFKLLGVCPEGGNRLLNPSGKIKIASIKPNPSDNEIEVELELVEKTGYKLIIVNSNGQTVKEITRVNTSKGISLEKIGVSDLASGVYNLILQTESERISKLFLIMK